MFQKQSKPSARSNVKSVPSTLELSQIGAYGSGDISYSRSSTTRHDVELLGNLTEVRSAGSVGGDDDFNDEPTVKERQLPSTFNESDEDNNCLPNEDDSVSVHTNDVWDYFSSYQINNSKNNVEILQQRTHKLDVGESQMKQNNGLTHADSMSVTTTIIKEEEINSTNNENNHLLGNRKIEESGNVLLHMVNQNGSLAPLSTRNLQLFEHGLE